MLHLTFKEWTKQKQDREVTEVLRQEWSCDHAEGKELRLTLIFYQPMNYQPTHKTHYSKSIV
jgi:hypothetical protein